VKQSFVCAQLVSAHVTNNSPTVHDVDSLSEGETKIEILVGYDHRQIALSVQPQKRTGDLVDDRRLNTFRRFVD
jgi:hypothetical protein